VAAAFIPAVAAGGATGATAAPAGPAAAVAPAVAIRAAVGATREALAAGSSSSRGTQTLVPAVAAAGKAEAIGATIPEVRSWVAQAGLAVQQKVERKRRRHASSCIRAFERETQCV